MKHLIFDIETTGLVPKGLNWETDYMQFPYIVQIAWKFLDSDIVNDFIIKPYEYEIPDKVSKIHGITNEIAMNKGKYFTDIIPDFIQDCFNADKIIGHNIYFDTSIIKANVLRYNNLKILSGFACQRVVITLDKSKRIDTMMKSIKFVGAKFNDGRAGKYPTLEELYFKLFNETFPAHNAKEDILATEKCYKKLVELGII
jgi:DNA polymerase-3 subunit alpha